MKKVIVSGPTGAIGVALINQLLRENMEVVAIVNPNSMRIDRLPIKDSRLKIVQCSLDEFGTLPEQKIGTCDVFFHLAWMGTIGPDRDDMDLQTRNISYALDAVKLAKRCGCKTFVEAGSQAEYGRVEGKLSAQTETNPETGYGIAKLCAGQMTRILCKQLEIQHIWTRILSVYGPCDGEETMIITGIRQMLKGECPSFSPGEQQWDYLYSEDAAKALYLLAEHGNDGCIYPIGSGQVRPLKEYIFDMRDVVEKMTSRKVQAGIGQLPYRSNQVMFLCADISELIKDTGFLPEVSFQKGIKETVEWCIKNEVETK